MDFDDGRVDADEDFGFVQIRDVAAGENGGGAFGVGDQGAIRPEVQLSMVEMVVWDAMSCLMMESMVFGFIVKITSRVSLICLAKSPRRRGLFWCFAFGECKDKFGTNALCTDDIDILVMRSDDLFDD